MSQKYILEIENYSGGKKLVVGVDSVVFTQYRHLSPATVGKTTLTAEKASEVILSRSFDQNSHLFVGQVGKLFPTAMLHVKASDGGKSLSFTLSGVYLESYTTRGIAGSDETLEDIKILFDKISYKENAPSGNAAKPKKSSDRKAEQIFNYLKN